MMKSLQLLLASLFTIATAFGEDFKNSASLEIPAGPVDAQLFSCTPSVTII